MKLDNRGRRKKFTILTTRGNKGTIEKTKESMKRAIEGLYEKNKNMDFLVEGSTGMDINSVSTTKSKYRQKENATRTNKDNKLEGGKGEYSSDPKKYDNDVASQHVTTPPDEVEKQKEIEGIQIVNVYNVNTVNIIDSSIKESDDNIQKVTSEMEEEVVIGTPVE